MIINQSDRNKQRLPISEKSTPLNSKSAKVKESSPSALGGLVFDVLKSVLSGMALFLFAVSILWMNEWHHLEELSVQQQEEAAVVYGDLERIDSEHEGRLLYLQGEVQAPEIRDDWLLADVSALRLYRRVEQFQRKATQEGTIGLWTDVPEAELPGLYSVQEKESLGPRLIEAETAQLGQFNISRGLLQKITVFERLPLKGMTFGDTGKGLPGQIDGGWTIEENCLYWQQSPDLPQVGDLRVSFYYVPGRKYVSLLARQSGETLEPFITSEGKVLEFLELGDYSAGELYPEGNPEWPWMVWLFRGMGVLMMWAGLWCLMALGRRVLLSLNLEGRNRKMSPGRLSLLVTVLCASLVIAAAWIYYQPLWATLTVIISSLLLIGGGYFYVRRYRLHNNLNSDRKLVEQSSN